MFYNINFLYIRYRINLSFNVDQVLINTNTQVNRMRN